MTDQVKANLEYANSVLADKMDANMDADDLKKLADGIVSTANILEETYNSEEKRKFESEKFVAEQDKTAHDEKKETLSTVLDVTFKVIDSVFKGICIAGFLILGANQKSDETNAYVTTPKTNNLVLDGLKSVIRH